MKKGFTLIELLIVIGIISILAAIVIVALNPAEHFKQARDAQRWSDVSAILNGVNQYMAANNGDLPNALATNSGAVEICVSDGVVVCGALEDLSDLVDFYIVAMPTDPVCPGGCAVNGVGYTIEKFGNDRIEVNAPDAEVGTIKIKR